MRIVSTQSVIRKLSQNQQIGLINIFQDMENRLKEISAYALENMPLAMIHPLLKISHKLVKFLPY